MKKKILFVVVIVLFIIALGLVLKVEKEPFIEPIEIEISKEYQVELPAINNRIVYISERFLGTPYRANTLIGGPDTPEQLVDNRGQVDCFTFLDYVLTEAVGENVKFIRYKDGIVSFETRNHYFTQWIENNSKYLFNASKDICLLKELDAVEGIASFEQEICYTSDLTKLENGDFVGFYTNKEGLDVTHVGIIIIKDSQIYLRHASSKDKKVVDEKLKDYLEKNKKSPGLIIARTLDNLVDIQKIDSAIKVDLKYSSNDNFLGADVYGDLDKCLLQKEVALMLANAQAYLKKIKPDYDLLVFDCLRPRQVQYKMWEIVKGTVQQKYLADPERGSMHNYGAAVDLTIIDSKGDELDMGTSFDFFGQLAEPKYEEKFFEQGQLTQQQVSNRKLLRKVMEKAGFQGISNEWWHFNAFSRNTVETKYDIVE